MVIAFVLGSLVGFAFSIDKKHFFVSFLLRKKTFDIELTRDNLGMDLFIGEKHYFIFSYEERWACDLCDWDRYSWNLSGYRENRSQCPFHDRPGRVVQRRRLWGSQEASSLKYLFSTLNR